MSDNVKEETVKVTGSAQKASLPAGVKTEWVTPDSVLVDMRGSLCPMPVIATKKAMEEHPGTIITTLVDNEVSRDNVTKFGQSRHCDVAVKVDGKTYYLTLTPSGIEGESSDSAADITKDNLDSSAPMTPAVGAIPAVPVLPQSVSGKVLLITKDYLGEGNEELGRTLMKTFLFCLAESDVKPSKIYFINSGVKMVAQGSPHLQNLQTLVEAGVSVAACGICLDFYNLKEQVAVGSITNLYAITEAMLTESMVTL